MGTENKSVPKATKSKSIKKKKKKRIKSSVSVSASSSTSKSKSKQKSKKKMTPKAKSEEQVIKAKRAYYSHGASISCSECDMCPIRGARFVCMIRENYNLCEECENKLVNEQEQYPMIKIFKPRANWHIKNFKGLQDLVAIPQIEEVLQISGNISTTTSIKAQAPSQEEESKTSTNSVPADMNDPSAMLKTFPFLSKEMQEKCMDAMKQFNDDGNNNKNIKKRGKQIIVANR